MHNLGLLFPHQLFETHDMFDQVDQLVLVEEFLFFKQYLFHQQKIAFHRASMKAFAALLVERSYQLRYIESTQDESDIRRLLPTLAKAFPEACIHYIDPCDYWLSQRLEIGCQKAGLSTRCYDNPSFLNTPADLATFFRKDKKSFFQTTFYKQQRKKRNILMNAVQEPVGGKWTYDVDNRKKYPKNKAVIASHFPSKNQHWQEAFDYAEQHFHDHLGSLSNSFSYPISHKDAEVWFQQFLDYRFVEFGDYEDAIVREEGILNHSLLSPLLNVGLLTPQGVLDKTLAHVEEHHIPINSLEGFIRQIIGWREFIRGMYLCKGIPSRTTNFWNFKRQIPAAFYDGTTGIEPVDETIKKVLQTGYCHHIERLMILGNFMLLCEFDPDAVYQWFMELFIDAYDWVMVPNVYGMSQFADGGLFATKPYISSSNYILKMSNYKKGDWQQIWDGLFWRFIHIHGEFFRKNPRLSMMYHCLQRMSEERKHQHLVNAEDYLQKLDMLPQEPLV